MPEHVFLCGLSETQRQGAPAGTVLSLAESTGNLRLRLERLRGRLQGSEPERLTDFVEIASYVFAADRTTRRGSLSDSDFGAKWRRNFLLVIAVRDLAFWQGQDVRETLAEALSFLSEDRWRFEFVANQHPIELPEYLGFEEREADSSGGTSVVLFSGGLDSLAGAVKELRTTNRHVVLVSHRNLPKMGERQAHLADQLAGHYPRRVTHVWVDNSLTNKLPDREETQRTRSFFFAAMAAVAAHIETSDRIRFYENGVMSINLPFVTQLVGARTSRSTHPRSLQLIGYVVSLVSTHDICIDNPFIWKTKAEVIQILVATSHAPLVRISVSCTRARTANRTFQPHCGTCIQCLHRRIATLAANSGDYDESEGYETDFLKGPRDDGHDRVAAVGSVKLALDCASISEPDFMDRFAEPLSWIRQAFPTVERDDATHQVIDLHRRHGLAVRALLSDAIQTLVPEVLDRTLAPSSLFALTLESQLANGSVVVSKLGPAELPKPPPETSSHDVVGEDIYVAIDDERQRILISNRTEISGPAIFRIMQLLINRSVQNRADGLLPKNYCSSRGKEIADLLTPLDEDAVRAAIKRARAEFKEADMALDGRVSDLHAIIETTHKGYRLNPRVLVVSPDEFAKI